VAQEKYLIVVDAKDMGGNLLRSSVVPGVVVQEDTFLEAAPFHLEYLLIGTNVRIVATLVMN